MKYILLIYGAEGRWTGPERTACMVESLALCDELATRGQFIDAAPLAPQFFCPSGTFPTRPRMH